MKSLQLTNPNIGAVATDALIPLGLKTVEYPINNCGCEQKVFTITSSVSDTVSVNKSGTYHIVYGGSFVAAETGVATIEIVVGNITMFVASTSATSTNTFNIAIEGDVYLPGNCQANPFNIPSYVQVKNAGVALTSGMGNLIITRY